MLLYASGHLSFLLFLSVYFSLTLTDPSVPSITRFAAAAEATVCIEAVGVSITSVSVQRTFVYV